MVKINKDIFIALTTRGRVDNQRTMDRLHPEILKYISLFCHPGESISHQKKLGRRFHCKRKFGRHYILE